MSLINVIDCFPFLFKWNIIYLSIVNYSTMIGRVTQLIEFRSSRYLCMTSSFSNNLIWHLLVITNQGFNKDSILVMKGSWLLPTNYYLHSAARLSSSLSTGGNRFDRKPVEWSDIITTGEVAHAAIDQFQHQAETNIGWRRNTILLF